ncbi:MAG: glutamate-1-semialdehyde 2,1-aminomutase [Actinomycetota bacterium]
MSDSLEAFERAKAVMPGGVSSPVRAFGKVGGTPRFVDRGEGAFLFDIEGRRYLDLCSSWGPLILGHAHPEVVAAIQEAVGRGTTFGAPTRAETELAEMVTSAIGCVDQVRFVNSGTEAAMSAIRVARAATGRDKILKFEGCYHGHADAFLSKAGSGILTHGLPDAAGVTAAAAADTITVPYNDLTAASEVLAMGDTAAVIVEPVAGNMGLVPPVDGFLEGLREATRTHGSLLIADEVITGFRLRYGIISEPFEPDLVVLGKIIGGGLPLAAYAGSRALMEMVAPVGPVYQAGTLSGNPVAVAAGLATLQVLERDAPYGALDDAAATIQQRLEGAGHPITVQRAGSMLTVFWTQGPVRNLEDALGSDTEAFASWFHRLLDEGVWWPPSPFETAFMSVPLVRETAHLADILEGSLAPPDEGRKKRATGRIRGT